MNKKFLVVFNNSQEKEIAKWWEDDFIQHYEASVFETFSEAKKHIRTKICDLFSDDYEQLIGYLFDNFTDNDYEIEEMFKIKSIVETILTQPDYFASDIMNENYTDDADHYFAFVCNDKYVIAHNYEWCLKFNVHNMDNENKYYYLELYNEEDCIASFKLINTENTIDDSHYIVENIVDLKQISFGSFVQTDDETVEPIVWDVISETDDRYFILSHKCLDYRVFNDGKNSSDWEKSELRKWLNSEFYNSAFSKSEKDRILLTVVDNGENKSTKDNIFLLNKNEFFLLETENTQAELTKYARVKYSKKIFRPYKEPYGFWWLREYNKNDRGYDLTHVCANGRLNSFARSDSSHPNGIRPAMWIKK